jgi:hypothetical protein
MSGKRLIYAKVDEENGCERCWDALRADLARAGVAEPVGHGLYPESWVDRPCGHGAPAHAPSILLGVKRLYVLAETLADVDGKGLDAATLLHMARELAKLVLAERAS